MSDQAFPSVPVVLLDALKRAFPDRIPDHANANLNILQGEQRVIRFLHAQFKEQNPQLFKDN